jgi:hypothetical protein
LGEAAISGEIKKIFVRTEYINLLNIGRSALKMEEVIWKNNYAHL